MRTKLYALAGLTLLLMVGAAWAYSTTGRPAPDGAPATESPAAGCCVTGDCCCPPAGACCDPSVRATPEAAKELTRSGSCCATGNCCCPGAGSCCAAEPSADCCSAGK